MAYDGWRTYKLDEVYEFSSGLSKKRDEFGFGYDFLTFKDVFNNYFLPNELTELANTTEKERQKCSIKRGDVFLTRTSESQVELGMSSVALKDYPNATFNGFTKRLRPKNNVEILPEYAGFYFRSPKFRNRVTSMSSMTTRASLNNAMLAMLTIDVPPVKEQKKIANVLSSLNSKVGINNQINKKLEELAQVIFKQWFVNFEFPNENNEPYKSSGGEMVESDLGLIPKGWEIGLIGDYVKVKSGFAFKSAWWEESGTPVIKIKDIENNTINFNNISYVSPEREVQAKDFLVQGGDLVIAMTGATIGKFGIVPKNDCRLLVNQRVGKFFLGENPFDKLGFIYCVLKQQKVYAEIANRGSGSAQPNISPTGIETIKIILPPNNKLLEKFNTLVRPNFVKIANNIYETSKLGMVRDLLVPQLMSGEIRIPLKN